LKKEVSAYIVSLLYRYDCVIIPGFGGLIASRRSARIDFLSNRFYPPSREIRFNSNLLHDDGLLISEIARCESCDYAIAGRMVSDYQKKLRDQLREAGKVAIPGVGKFFRDNHQLLQFEPDSESHFLTDSYGLGNFHFPSVTAKQPLQFSERSADSVHLIRLPYRKVISAVAAVALLTFLSVRWEADQRFPKGFASLLPFNNGGETGLIFHQSPDYQQSILPETPGTADVTSFFEAMHLAGESSKQIPFRDLSSPGKKYYLITGSFCAPKPAQTFCQRMDDAGIKTVILEPENGKIRVAAGVYRNKADAMDALTVLRKVNPDTWILKK
jgi:hypothetical protein